MNKNEIILLKQKATKKGAYVLEKYTKGYKIPIVSDTMFQTMLNNESRKQYVSYFISLLLEIPYESILNNIHFAKERLDKDMFNESNKTVDLVCKISDATYNIEMNNQTSAELLERNLAYLFRLYSSNMRVGTMYNYEKVVQINMNNFSFENYSETIEKYQLIDKNDGKVFTEKITIINIYLPNIRKKYYNKEELSDLEKLLLIFNETKIDLLDELKEDNIIMDEYIKDSIDTSDNTDIVGLYDKELHLKIMNEIEKKHAQEEGLKKGKKEGKKEEKLEIALNMLNRKMDIQLISDITGLTIDELNRLGN